MCSPHIYRWLRYNANVWLLEAVGGWEKLPGSVGITTAKSIIFEMLQYLIRHQTMTTVSQNLHGRHMQVYTYTARPKHIELS